MVGNGRGLNSGKAEVGDGRRVVVVAAVAGERRTGGGGMCVCCFCDGRASARVGTGGWCNGGVIGFAPGFRAYPFACGSVPGTVRPHHFPFLFFIAYYKSEIKLYV